MFGVVIGFFMLDLVITRCSGADILTVDNFPDTEKQELNLTYMNNNRISNSENDYAEVPGAVFEWME